MKKRTKEMIKDVAVSTLLPVASGTISGLALAPAAVMVCAAFGPIGAFVTFAGTTIAGFGLSDCLMAEYAKKRMKEFNIERTKLTFTATGEEEAEPKK